MGIHNLAGAKQIEELGFTRVVLSRETKLNDIVEIKNNTNLEMEYFVQGALCVAFSGNCYLSSINADKSGNRGECMQLFRLKYSAISNDELQNQGYLLSTTDLCLINNLKQLIDAGVSSFKIEGRLRRYGYIAESVKQYSNALKNLDKFNYKNAENALFKVFNRGQYNKGLYLTENCKREVINEKFQNHRGVCVGKVKEVSPFKTLNQIILSSTHKLNEGDGLKFIKNGEEISIGVGNVIELKNGLYKIFSNKTPEVNSDVYLTVDSLHESDLVKESKKLNIDIYVELQVNAVPYVRA
jgi:putative protease